MSDEPRVAYAAGVPTVVYDRDSGELRCSSAKACQASGITYRQLCFWVKRRVVTPTQPPHGSGSVMRWSYDDVLRLRFVALLAGIDSCNTRGLTTEYLARAVSGLPEQVPDEGAAVVFPSGLLHHGNPAAIGFESLSEPVVVVAFAPIHQHVAAVLRPAAAHTSRVA